MKFQDVEQIVVSIIQGEKGRFLSAYQICQQIARMNPVLWASLVREYPSVNSDIPMGEGTGKHYSPASFVANALRNLVEKRPDLGLRQERFGCDGVSFDGVDPGFTGNEVGIWAINA